MHFYYTVTLKNCNNYFNIANFNLLVFLSLLYSYKFILVDYQPKVPFEVYAHLPLNQLYLKTNLSRN